MTDKERLIHVTYRRQVNDGNYGTESVEVYLEWYVESEPDEPDIDRDAAKNLLAHAHDIAHAQLGSSRSATVRRATESRTTAPPPPARPPSGTPEDELEDLPF